MQAEIPYRDQLVDNENFLSRAWQLFFRKIQQALIYLGDEYFLNLTNNQAAPANIQGMKFDYRYVSCAVIEALVQRVTDSVELVESGEIRCEYLPDSESWQLSNDFTTVGITFSITSAGQVQYTSTNIAGTQVLSRIVYRVRSLYGKAYYSKVG